MNHALSQSVPASVVTTVNGFTKVFAGEMVEKARTIQAEWADAHDQAELAAFEAEEKEADARAAEANEAGIKKESDSPNGTSQSQSQSTTRPRREFRPSPNPHRGQLLPSHLREALRRYKRDCEGGNVGLAGLSMDNLGVRGSMVWNTGGIGGRRLFR